jgi:tetratricopeptide (TPR) repeat protein
MDPAALTQLAQQATNILVPAFSALCIAGKPAVDKGKEVLVDLIYEKAFEKLGSESGKRAQALLEKISPKMSESLEKALTNVFKNSQDPKAKEELQQKILNLLMENPGLVKEIKPIVINFNVKNVDQLALGNYNNFFNLKTPSENEFIKIIEYLDQKRKEAANQEILNRYNPSTLPYYPEKLKLFVTKNRSEELRKALTYLENHRILLLSGVGGVGKSTLARALIDLRPVNVPEPFWFDFNKNQSAKLGDILEKLASYMTAPEIASFKNERREPGKLDVDKLTGEFQRRSEAWLIFDDLSTVLEDQYFADDGIELLFYSLRYNTHNAKIIVTSRTLPIFENGEKLIDVVENEDKQDLKGLNKDFAVDYLASNGLDEVEPEKLEKLATSMDGHPLALKILVELVKEFGATDVIQDLSLYRKDKEDTIIKARKLFDKLAGNEKELLERISVYREPVSIKGINEIFTENTPVNVIRKLIDKSLLETDHNGTYWLHPLVQEFSYEDLKNKKEAHMAVVKYYLSIPLPKNPTKKEELQSAIEAHYHAFMAEEYDQAFNIIFDNNLHEYLDLWGNYTVLIDLYSKLLPKNYFGKETLLRDNRNGITLGNLGLAYSGLGENRKAIEYYEQALKISREIGDRKKEGIWLGDLGNAYRDLGETRKAIEYYEQTLKIFREIGDRKREGAGLGNLGNAYSDLGKIRKAIEYYEQALKIAREIEDRKREGIWLGNLGIAYSHMVETRKAIEYYEQALKTAKEIGDRKREGVWLGNLGIVYRHLGEPKKAIEYYEQAIKIFKEVCDRNGEGFWLENLGLAYSDLGEHRKAIEFLKQSLAIGKAIEDPRIISFCENKLKELNGIEDNKNSNYYPSSNNYPALSRPPASKNLFQTIVSKLKSKK